MKRISLAILTAFCVWTVSAQQIRVISDQYLGHGYYPQLSEDASQLIYLENESDDYADEMGNPAVRVFTKDLNLYIEQNGTVRQLKPHGDVNYIWESVSPDGTKILFNSPKGTAVCDLHGQEIANLGKLNMPVWYGNDYIVGMVEKNDGHQYISCCLHLRSLDSNTDVTLTDPDGMAMFPSVSASTGKVAYATLNGDIRLLQLTLTDMPISDNKPVMMKAANVRRPKKMQDAAQKEFKDLKIYINPGHGGYTGNDRGIQVYPFASGDTLGFWESSSNLSKGLMLDTMLRNLGVQTKLSRVLNRESDDLDLSVIVAQANAFNADFMLSIHSNAGTPSNYVLQLYAGKDLSDTRTYYDEKNKATETISRDCSTMIGNLLWSNQITTWVGRKSPYIAGDKTFAHDIMGWSNGYGVLRNLRVPGEISEGCMHDYKPETSRLLNVNYRRQESWNFLRAFCRYFLNYKQTVGAIIGQVRDLNNIMLIPDYYRTPNSMDDRRPILNAEVTLLKDGVAMQTCRTDSFYNGVFGFWDLTPGTYVVKTSKEGYYDHYDTLQVIADELTNDNVLLNMVRPTRPEIVDFSPKPATIEDSMQVAVPIYFEFNWDMQLDSTTAAFSITPNVPGRVVFENSNHRLHFVPESNLDASTEYEVRISTQACHLDTENPNHLAEDFVVRFRTMDRSNYKILQSYPADNQTGVMLNPQFTLVMDNPVSSKTISANIVVEDKNGNTQKLNSRTMTTTNSALAEGYGFISLPLVTPLQPESEYTLIVKGNLTDKLGVTHKETTRIPFRTGTEMATEGELVDDMENLSFKVNPDKSVDVVTSSVLLNKNIKNAGSASNELFYSFDNTSATAEVAFSTLNPTAVYGDNQSSLSFYVCGDLSGNQLMAEWNCEGDVMYTPVTVLDFSGWQYVKADMSILKDGFRYQLTGLKIVYQPGLLATQGSIFIDNMMAIQAEDRTGLEKVRLNTSDSGFDVLGRPIHSTQSGQIVIINGEKQMVK